jgi:hypothetical protein
MMLSVQKRHEDSDLSLSASFRFEASKEADLTEGHRQFKANNAQGQSEDLWSNKERNFH